MLGLANPIPNPNPNANLLEQVHRPRLVHIGVAKQLSLLRPLRHSCERVGAQILSLGAAFGGLAGGFELAGATA